MMQSNRMLRRTTPLAGLLAAALALAGPMTPCAEAETRVAVTGFVHHAPAVPHVPHPATREHRLLRYLGIGWSDGYHARRGRDWPHVVWPPVVWPSHQVWTPPPALPSDK